MELPAGGESADPPGLLHQVVENRLVVGLPVHRRLTTATRIEWGEFFEIFDENDLNFLYQDKTADGGTSRFNKFVSGE